MSPRPGSRASGPPRVLVVDDAEGIRRYVADLLELRGYEVDSAEDGRRALALIEGGAAPDAILLDVLMPGLDGLETLRRIRERAPGVPVVMLSVVADAGRIVQAMQLGAADYVNKPLQEDELEASLSQALRGADCASPEAPPPDPGPVWVSDAMRQIRALLEQVRDTDVTILIHGESGVGKEVVARTAHELSPRAGQGFVKVNCAALPEELLESELFGYEKGAFTGAISRKPGKFEQAHRGAIFLDEIGEMSVGLQAKLLQVLQDREFTRLGGNREVAVDVRVLCATNRRLEEMVQEGTFREDLYFRLNVVSVYIPPLRERREDLPGLIETFARRATLRYGKPRFAISERLLAAFARYSFPGNVRELENMVKRAVVLENEAPILSEIQRRERERSAGLGSLRELIEEVEQSAGELPLREVGRLVATQAERDTIRRTLHLTGWNRKQAAKLLGVSYKTLLQKIRQAGLQPE